MATPVSNSISLTGDVLIDGLMQGSSWSFADSHVLTYTRSLNVPLLYPNNQSLHCGRAR